MLFALLVYYNELMKKVAKENNADFTDPMVAGIFVNIISWTSVQRNTDITPYWGTLKSRWRTKY